MHFSWGRMLAAVGAGAVSALGCAAAWAQSTPDAGTVGPTDWAIGFQPSASPIMQSYADLWTLLWYIIVAITIFVSALLVWVMIRYNRRANPVASTTSHNTVIEVVWTVLPVLILVVIAIPSFQALYYGDRDPDAEMTVEVTGLQWYWGYRYPDERYGIERYDSRLVDERQESQAGLIAARKAANQYHRLLSADNPLVLPVDTSVRILVTGNDVIHSFAIPAGGVKRDAVPGRMNETWVKFDKTGTFFGQCSEICGTDHAYMPIEVRVVPKEQFERWAAQAKTDVEAANRDVLGYAYAQASAQ